MKILYNAVSTLIFIIFISALLIISVDLNCFNTKFYQEQYYKLNTAETIGISQEQLMEATSILLNYLKDKSNNVDYKANINGENREVFNQREKTHMVDVKNLYQNAIKYKNFALGLTAFWLVVTAVYVKFKSKNSLKTWLNNLAKAFFRGVGLFALLLIGLMAFAVIDFNSFWNNFHLLFFTNDLWLLDPATDIMLMMVPEEFFFALVLKIVLTFVILVAVTSLLVKLLALWCKKEQKL